MVLENTSNLYHEKQGDNNLCGMHVINNLFGKENTVTVDVMKGYCKDCATCLPDLTEEECKNPENIQQFCDKSGENFDIYVLIYAIMVMDDYEVSVLPHYFKDSIPNNCLKKYSDTINWIEWDNTIISNLLTNNIVGVIFRKTKGIHHYVAFKKTNYDKKKGATFTKIDSKKDDVTEYSQQALIDYLLRYDAYKNGCIIVNEKSPSSSSSTVDADADADADVDAEAEADVDAGEKDKDAEEVNIQDDTTETEESSNEEYQGDTTETEEGIESRQQNQGENTINAEKDGITEALKHTMRVRENPTDKDGKSPQLTNSATTEGAKYYNSALADTFTTMGTSNANTPSNNKASEDIKDANPGTVEHETQTPSGIQSAQPDPPKFKKGEQVIYTKNKNTYAVIVQVEYDTPPDYAYVIKVDGGEINTLQQFLRSPTDAETAEWNKNKEKTATQSTPPTTEEEAKSAKQEPENNDSGYFSDIRLRLASVASNLRKTLETQGEKSQAPEPAKRMTTRSASAAQNETNQRENETAEPGTPVKSDSDSSAKDVIMNVDCTECLTKKNTKYNKQSCNQHRENECEWKNERCCENKPYINMIKRIDNILDNTKAKDVASITDQKCKNYIDDIKDIQNQPIYNEYTNKTFASKKTSLTKRKKALEEKCPSQKGGKSRRKKKSAKRETKSRKKKHTKKHRKNSRKKSKSMRRVKKLKK